MGESPPANQASLCGPWCAEARSPASLDPTIVHAVGCNRTSQWQWHSKGRMCVCGVWGQPLFPRDLRIAQFFSFEAGGASSPSSLAPTKTLDECWWYLTWSVRHTYLPWYHFDFWFLWFTHSGARILKRVWVQRPITSKLTNRYEPHEQTFCLTRVRVCRRSNVKADKIYCLHIQWFDICLYVLMSRSFVVYIITWFNMSIFKDA